VVPQVGSYLGHTGRAADVVARAPLVKVFGRQPSRTFPPARRPASENLQGTKPRGGARIERCRAFSYGSSSAVVRRPQWRQLIHR